MTLRIRALTCGWLTGPRGLFLRGEQGRLRVPVPAFLIEHPAGRVLFDTGLHVDAARDPAARLGAAASLFEVELGAGEDLAARLEALDVDPAGVRTVVLSHLHFDHAGGLGALPNAEVWVQRTEWEAGADPERAARLSYVSADLDLGHALRRLDGACDVFGDGSVRCLPTPGHTPGHQSLRVRLASGEVVLCADACYLRESLDELHLPRHVFDEAAMRASLLRLRRLRDRGARIFYGHDPGFWQTVPQAPAAVA